MSCGFACHCCIAISIAVVLVASAIANCLSAAYAVLRSRRALTSSGFSWTSFSSTAITLSYCFSGEATNATPPKCVLIVGIDG